MTPPGRPSPDGPAVAALALRHGIALAGELEWVDVGLDFRVALANDDAGRPWVLRIPRRPDVRPRAENEARALRLLRGRLPAEVPEWQVDTPELIAYRRLAGTTAMSLDPATHAPTWHIDTQSPAFSEGLARTLAALHGTDPAAAAAAGLRVSSPDRTRRAFADDLERVRREVGIGERLLRRWRAWLDDDASWPPFAALIHGDLHAGHVLVDRDARVTGVLDWTEAEVGDPSVDFVFHLMAFGEDGLGRLLAEYEASGGRTWPGLRAQVRERLSAVPLRYALFALENGLEEHLEAAGAQLRDDP